MEKFTALTAVAAPLPMDNLDTDQLMPKQFLRGIDKSGLGAGLFWNLRMDAEGRPRPECVLNRPGFEETRILVCGPNFGCGSSREHAVWGLLQYGIRAVIAPSFGEIFYSNCFNNGLLAARVTPEAGREILESVSETEPVELLVDLEAKKIRTKDGQKEWDFAIAPRHRQMLLLGQDMTDATLSEMDEIEAFRARHEAAFPWMAGLPGKRRRLRDAR
ncbi:3-isopropylmalate dehydratase small subunit [Sutterella sp.]|uniref:3-isopropylmalate dehydratase small subunit n=1 Tax=Sutterella sp. TaxID=1981025 RepID=UPI0026E08645|nr:3-isopropylmalate dehydratase small subunit [Sutterella sp.]MDO5530778.1 3-isopropylmalate dehydratase small subunit [Sutterella sp.]